MFMRTVIILLLLGILAASNIISVSAQEGKKTWKTMSKTEKEEYMYRTAMEYYVEYGGGTYNSSRIGKFSEEVNSNVKTRSKGTKNVIRITFPKSKQSRAGVQAFAVDFDKDTGLMVGMRLPDGQMGKVMTLGTPDFTNDKINYNGMVTNKNQSPYKDIVNKCLEAIKTCGPDFYPLCYSYNVANTYFKGDGIYNSVTKQNGREYYLILFNYDLNKISLPTIIAAEVCMWRDTEEIWKIRFGNGEELVFLDTSYSNVKTQKGHKVIRLKEGELKEKKLQIQRKVRRNGIFTL